MATQTAAPASPTSTDRIEKQFEVTAKRSRVWHALADATQFGEWFGMSFDKPFTPGARLMGKLTNPKYVHIPIEMVIDAIEPETRFSYRWHPFPMDATRDYNVEPMTLVEFSLTETAGGTAVTIVESGFDSLPADRRAEAFRMNDGGWTSQSKKFAEYVTR